MGRTKEGSRLVAIVALCLPLLSSPDGSYTEEQSQESEHKVLATDFDDEFDDEEPLPAIGTCKALYTFEGTACCPGEGPCLPGPTRLLPVPRSQFSLVHNDKIIESSCFIFSCV